VLPTAVKGGEPLPEGLLWLLLTGKVYACLYSFNLNLQMCQTCSIKLGQYLLLIKNGDMFLAYLCIAIPLIYLSFPQFSPYFYKF
jgi:hypothetical protein